MKHLKEFKIFEELKISTYQNAADQLSLKGHNKRAHELNKHANEKIVKGGNFEYYTAKFNAKVTNPKYVTNTIAEMDLSVEIASGEAKTPSYLFTVTFQNPRDLFVFNLSDESAKCENCIKFKERKDARRFVAMCNKYIDDNIESGASYKKLIINDFYTE